MLKKNNLKKSCDNCFLDLQRAATAFYLNPKGKTHQVFLKHSLKILEEIEWSKAKDFWRKIFQLATQTSKPAKTEREKTYLAEQILTLGCLMRY